MKLQAFASVPTHQGLQMLLCMAPLQLAVSLSGTCVHVCDVMGLPHMGA